MCVSYELRKESISSEYLLELFGSRIHREVFIAVAQVKRVSLGVLATRFELTVPELEGRLERLADAGLVLREGAILPEWQTYLVTALGLSVERHLRRWMAEGPYV